MVVSTSDERTGRQIDDTSVEASVAPPGPEEARRRMEPMKIAYAMTYGNFFP